MIAEDDPDRLKRQKNAAAYKGLAWMRSDELLAVPGLQAVAIETEERVCIPPALRSIRAGKHIHLDKPCGESLPAFKELLDEAKARQLTVQVGYMYRNNPAVRFCIKAARDGLIGRLATVRTSITEAQGFANRRFKVMGDKGTITIRPIESKCGMSGGVLTLSLEEDRGGYKKGIQTVEMPPLKGRYEGQWREFAAVLNGEIVNPYTYEHDYLVHKCHLQACAMLIDV